MIREFLVYILMFFSMSLWAQDTTERAMMERFATNQSESDVEAFAAHPEKLSALSLYYVGEIYFQRDNNTRALHYLDLSLTKDSTYASAYGLKGSALYNLGKFEEAIRVLTTALKLKPGTASYSACLGDCYLALHHTDQALLAYNTAAIQDSGSDHPYMMIACIYEDRHDLEKARQSWYRAKATSIKGGVNYKTVLYSISRLETALGDADKAERALIEIIQEYPTDYQAFTNLIQRYYQKGEYDKAIPYKAGLYAAHNKGLLQDTLRDMFCYDQFSWKDKQVLAYERFGQGAGDMKAKQIFYIKNKDGALESTIMLEIAKHPGENGSSKRELHLIKGKTMSAFPFGSGEDYRYEDLKKAVLDILGEKGVPTSLTK